MQLRKWPSEAEHQRIEAVAILARLEELADAAFDALESGDSIRVANLLGQMRNRASKGKYLLRFQPQMAAYDNELSE